MLFSAVISTPNNGLTSPIYPLLSWSQAPLGFASAGWPTTPQFPKTVRTKLPLWIAVLRNSFPDGNCCADRVQHNPKIISEDKIIFLKVISNSDFYSAGFGIVSCIGKPFINSIYKFNRILVFSDLNVFCFISHT